MLGELLSAATNVVPFVAPFFGRKRDNSAKVAQLQYQQNLDFWNRQNAYNHPAAQMRRFQEAGLNPHLIYGQTNTAGPIATPSVSGGDDDRPDYLEGLFKYQSLKNGEAQHELIEAQKDFALEQAANSVFNRELASKNYILSAENQEMNRGLVASQILLNNARAAALKTSGSKDEDPGLLESIGKPLATAAGGLAGALGMNKIHEIIKNRFFPDVVGVDNNGRKHAVKLASNVVKKTGKSAISGFLGKAGRFLGKTFIKRWWPFAVASMFVD